jgi:hypothetical protein
LYLLVNTFILVLPVSPWDVVPLSYNFIKTTYDISLNSQISLEEHLNDTIFSVNNS